MGLQTPKDPCPGHAVKSKVTIPPAIQSRSFCFKDLYSIVKNAILKLYILLKFQQLFTLRTEKATYFTLISGSATVSNPHNW